MEWYWIVGIAIVVYAACVWLGYYGVRHFIRDMEPRCPWTRGDRLQTVLLFGVLPLMGPVMFVALFICPKMYTVCDLVAGALNDDRPASW